MTNNEINSDFYDLEYYLSMELRYLSGAHQAKIDLFLKTVGNLTGKKVLDLGCGGGYFAYLAKQRGAEVIGVDYSQSAINFAKNRYKDIDFRVADALTLKEFSDSTFDLVLLMDVIEHIKNQDESLNEIRRILKNEGKLLISTDLDDSPWNKNIWHQLIWRTYMLSKSGRSYLLIKKVEEERRRYKNYHNSHVSVRTLDELKKMLADNKFHKIETHIYALVKVWIRDVLLKTFPKKYRGDHVLITARKN